MRPFLCIPLVAALTLGPAIAGAREKGEQTNPQRLDEKPNTNANYGEALAAAFSQLGDTMAWIELAVPDLRLQTPGRVADGVEALVVSWPIALLSWTTGSRRSDAGLVVFVEPQFPTNELSIRGLAGVRAFGAIYGLAAIAEAGAMAASDSSGAFAGAGPAIGDRHGMIAAVGRRYFAVVGPARWDFTIELSLPTRPLFALLGW